MSWCLLSGKVDTSRYKDFILSSGYTPTSLRPSSSLVLLWSTAIVVHLSGAPAAVLWLLSAFPLTSVLLGCLTFPPVDLFQWILSMLVVSANKRIYRHILLQPHYLCVSACTYSSACGGVCVCGGCYTGVFPFSTSLFGRVICLHFFSWYLFLHCAYSESDFIIHSNTCRALGDFHVVKSVQFQVCTDSYLSVFGLLSVCFFSLTCYIGVFSLLWVRPFPFPLFSQPYLQL